MHRRLPLVAGVAVVVLAVAIVGFLFLAPKGSTTVHQAAPSDAAEVTAQGTFHGAGDGFHQASGSVKLLRVGDGYVLRFEDYEATAGPDVYYYLTPSADARTTDQVEGAGLAVRVPGGAPDGQATLRGSFNVPLPAGTDPAAYHGLVVWCRNFNAYFGGAALEPAHAMAA